MKYIARILLLMAVLEVPQAAYCQSEDTRKRSSKSEIKVNKLDVIYEDEEYKGVVIDARNDEDIDYNLYQSPFMLDDGDDDDDIDDDAIPVVYDLSDDPADSEDEILLEGFDTAAIHLPKMNVADMTGSITIKLRDPQKGEQFAWPTPLWARPSSHFGPRRRRFHYGLDLALPTGEPLYAAFDGVVRISKRNPSYGHLVIIHHPNGLETYYAHMSARHVVAGQQVKAGDVIGLCGNTGRSHGSHLHFEIRYMGNAINPENVVDCATHDLISDELVLTPSSFRKVSKYGKGNGAGGSTGWYRVRKGDTLNKIARRNGTTVKRLCQLNGIRENKTLTPGMRLKVSGSASKSNGAVGNGAKASKGKATYVVRKGDTLGKIAQRNGVTIKELCRLNGISKNSTLREGQKLKVK